MNHKRQILNEQRPGSAGGSRLRHGASPRQVAVASERRTIAAPRAAFTLIELLVVMLIIVILAGITISVSKYASWRARKAMADIELQKIRAALDEYRAVYGEYPIVGDGNVIPGSENHYPKYWPTNPDTSNNVPVVFRYVDLVNTAQTIFVDGNFVTVNTNTEGMPGVEYLPLGTKVRVDYRLTYALKMRPESEGRAPFKDFPMFTVCSMVYKNINVAWERDVLDYKGQWIGRYIMGDPVNRNLAVNPLSRCQWHYTSSNGTTYTLTDGSDRGW
ncbi:MAG: type II secretion system GspH family protein [Verrucomicrobia bacterium]|nr:type II secretion system GspH family protein [Verrucomicrobiota bacterium]MCG2678411.1 type II secretion system GspH family protein [Kiritimatiellia bacterium]MBU4247832.1 type II secretion system GspH family protein [Verrucomicrobiota bacterium]MBU4291962.1 type II secretion system GspH family protein [Verrucomicrobiota bacterium]MBU4429846.1 type II secretion system GspH family protein [Verrucomicrobiota bacterium]